MSPGRLRYWTVAAVLAWMLGAACAGDESDESATGSATTVVGTTPVPETLTVTVPSPVKVNGEASARVSGAEGGSTCSIRYRTPAGTQSDADGLANKPAGQDGVATWAWTIGPSTRPGEGTVNVTCGSARGSAKFTIE